MTCKKFHDFTEKIIAIAEAPFARMAIADAVEGKGKRKLIEQESPEEETESTNASSTSDSDSDSSDSDSDEEEVTQDYLNSLLEKARQNYAALEASSSTQKTATEDVLVLDADDSEKPLPSLEPGKVPAPYFKFEDPASGSRLSIRDPEVESAEKAFSAISGPAPPIPPPELTKSGKPLTLKEKKQLKKKTAGPDWFELPAPSESELPRLYREVEALRLRNQLDPKRFYRKDEGEGKGIKGLPKYFAIGTVLPTSTPFGTASSDNLTRANRKRTLVDELVDDAETRHYAKKKFNELQGDRHAKGRRTLAAKKALRKPKW